MEGLADGGIRAWKQKRQAYFLSLGLIRFICLSYAGLLFLVILFQEKLFGQRIPILVG